MEQYIRNVIVMDVLAALATHAWMKRCDPLPLKNVVLALATVPSIPVCVLFNQHSFLINLAWAYLVFHSVLVCSVVVYRLSSYHPLAEYPGPTIMKVTKFRGVWIAYTGKTHIYLKALHDKYGPTVRIGPNELSTVEKDLIPQILGNQGMPKGPLWDGRRFSQTETEVKKKYSLIDVRDSAVHSELRKPWNKAFSAEPMKDYETLLLPRVIQMNSQLREIADTSRGEIGRVDIAKWIDYFSFDFMGDMAFGGSFQLMREGDIHGYLRCMGEGLYLPSILQHIPWSAKLLRSVPIINAGMQKFINFGVAQGLKRASIEMKRKDLFYHIVFNPLAKAESSTTSESDLPMIISNALLAIVAGSDTSSTVMSSAIYFLVSNPEAYKDLQSEVDYAFRKYDIPDMDTEMTSGGEVTGHRNEVMRLFPSVPTGLQRAPANSSTGKLLKRDFLPEGNAISVPPYVIHRDPRYFSPAPDNFVPERWFSSSLFPSTQATEFVTSRDAFIPFSFGPQSCAGRSLALMEIRYVLSTLVRNFDMEFDTPQHDPMRWEKDMADRFTLSKGSLHIRITPRLKGTRGT
ncbi:cytochrome P450 [Flammula alnicola]|nr:cytochrome P450 [Flammula alnicola]